MVGIGKITTDGITANTMLMESLAMKTKICAMLMESLAMNMAS